MAALTAGSVPAVDAAAWLRHVDQHPDVAMMRADSRRTLSAIVRRLVERSDHRTGTVTILWAELREAAGVTRSTVGHWLKWLRERGLLATVHGGARSAAGNTAPCYLPLMPATEPADLVDNSANKDRTPSCTSERSQPLRARATTTDAGLPAGGQRSALRRPRLRYTVDRLPHPRSPKYARYTLAAALAAARPLLFGRHRARLSALAHALRHVAAAGWTLADVLALLDGPGALPVPTGTDETDAVRHPARWLAYRLTGAELAERPTVAAAHARAAAAAAHRADQERHRALLAAIPHTGVQMPAALRAQLDRWRTGRDRARRRSESVTCGNAESTEVRKSGCTQVRTYEPR